MATIKQGYAAPATVLTLGTLASVTGILSSAVDNSTNLYLSADLEIKCNITVATLGVDFYLAGSIDNTDWWESGDDLANLTYIGSVQLVSATEQTKVLRIEQLPKYWKIYAYNNDTTALLSGTVDYSGISLTNA